MALRSVHGAAVYAGVTTIMGEEARTRCSPSSPLARTGCVGVAG